MTSGERTMTMQGQGNGNAAPPPAGDAGAPPAGGTGQGSAQAPAAAGTASTGNGGDDGDQPMSLSEARALRRENAGYRTRLDDLEKAERARQQAGMSEIERERTARTTAERERDEARSAAQAERLAARIETAATRLGFVDPEAAVRFLDRGHIEYEADGTTPKNLDSLLKELLRAKPYLKGQSGGSANAGDGNRGPAPQGGNNMNALIRQGAGRGTGVTE